MNDGLKGKVALITGAGKRNGIGFGIAERLAAAGVDVVISDLVVPPRQDLPITYGSLEEMKSLAGELQVSYGVQALAVEMDVTSTESIDEAMSLLNRQFGGLDFVFNNAGTVFGAPQPIHRYDETSWIQTFDVNLHGVFRVSKAAVALMQGRAGAIVNIASKAGKSPAPLNGAYAASKAGVIMVTRVMALELGSENIRVNAVCPGLIKTDLQKGNIALKAHLWGINVDEAEKRLNDSVPLGRMGDIREVADVCVYLVSDNASYITGQAINVGGGLLTEA
jgi:NAD(P)-dependent dehydrogenase (short-subunit alcohol dehydrogenase family)